MLKLYQPDPMAWDAIRRAHKSFLSEPMCVGLAPFGSRAKGYYEDSSDIDAKLLFDSSLWNGEWRNPIVAACEITKDFKEIKFSHFDLNNFDNPVVSLREVTRLVTGNKIRQYRKRFFVWLKAQNNQDEIIEAIIDRHVRFETIPIAKWAKRWNTTEDRLLQERKQLWTNRVKALLDDGTQNKINLFPKE